MLEPDAPGLKEFGYFLQREDSIELTISISAIERQPQQSD